MFTLLSLLIAPPAWLPLVLFLFADLSPLIVFARRACPKIVFATLPPMIVFSC
jgi:hypothetical protein